MSDIFPLLLFYLSKLHSRFSALLDRRWSVDPNPPLYKREGVLAVPSFINPPFFFFFFFVFVSFNEDKQINKQITRIFDSG